MEKNVFTCLLTTCVSFLKFFSLKCVLVYVWDSVYPVITTKEFREKVMSALVFILPEKYLLVFYCVPRVGLCGVRKKYNAKFLFLKVLKVYNERGMCVSKPRA